MVTFYILHAERQVINRVKYMMAVVPPGPVHRAQSAEGLFQIITVGLHASLADAKLTLGVQTEYLVVAGAVAS